MVRFERKAFRQSGEAGNGNHFRGSSTKAKRPFSRYIHKLRMLPLLVLGLVAPKTHAFCLLTHEQIVDIAWKDDIVPLLQARFPGASAEDLRKAHAFAYGGCLVHDMGYYPLGRKFFTDLAHYVRSGDFVASMLREATNRNELAFALGALAHYCSDNLGHPVVNRVVAMSYPKLAAKYGKEVTYAEDPKAHMSVEFGFDMAQIAQNRYSSDRYRQFIGFEVSTPLLERVFVKTYGLELREVIGDPGLSIGTFRRSASKVIPELTRVALATRRPALEKATPNFNQKEFLFHLSRSEYEREWGKEYRKPGLLAQIVALFVRWVPKIGVFKALDFQVPTAETEEMYMMSINKTVEAYKSLLRDVGRDYIELGNADFDTGREASTGEYKLGDETYARLLDLHAKHNFAMMSPELRANILKFYGESTLTAKRKPNKRERKIRTQLTALAGMQTVGEGSY